MEDLPKKQIFCTVTVGNYGKVKEILHVKTHHNIFALFEGDDECAASGNVLCKHVPGECVCVSK